MKGFKKLLEGIVKYSLIDKPHSMFKLKIVGNNPNPLAMVFSCMDSRVIPSNFINNEIGDNYTVKNAGNFVPYPDDLTQMDTATAAAGALELTCVRNNMRHVVVTGHSDCKAMQLLHGIREDMNNPTGSPLELWIKKNGKRTLEKFSYLKEDNGFMGPVPFALENDNKNNEVYIDPDQEYNMLDKLSQVNCVQQLENISAYPFLKERLSKKDLFLHALWYDLHSGNVLLLSKRRQRFVEVNDRSYFALIKELDEDEKKS